MKARFNFILNCFMLVPLFLFTLSCGTNESEKVVEEEVEVKEAKIESKSIYQVPLEWHSQHGDTLTLDTLEGKIPIMAMVFTNCGYACPRMVADLKNIQKKLPADKKDDVVFVLVSFDTERDTPQRLKQYSREMQLQGDWLLLHGDEDEVRTLSMLLDVHYKRQESGDFAHSNKIVLLDTEGEIVAEVDGLGSDPSPILNKLKELS